MLSGLVVAISLLTIVQELKFDMAKLQVGTLTLDDRVDLIAKAPRLKLQVEDEMAKLNVKYEEIHCTAMRIPGSWDEIGGTRISPYVCQFGERWLLLRTKVRVTDKRGKVLDPTSKTAQHQAVKVEETNPTWVWSDKKPRIP